LPQLVMCHDTHAHKVPIMIKCFSISFWMMYLELTTVFTSMAVILEAWTCHSQRWETQHSCKLQLDSLIYDLHLSFKKGSTNFHSIWQLAVSPAHSGITLLDVLLVSEGTQSLHLLAVLLNIGAALAGKNQMCCWKSLLGMVERSLV
jgi:hypothetical protein